MESYIPRRKFFVKKGLQGRLLLAVVSAALFSFALLIVDYYFYFGRNLPTSPWDTEMMWIFFKAHRLAVIQLVVFVTALTFITLVLSHRVAGPLINIEKSLTHATMGDLTYRVRLRPKDDLKELRDAFNKMMESFQAKVAVDRARAEEARLAVEKAMAHHGLDTAGRDGLKRAAELLSGLTRQFKV